MAISGGHQFPKKNGGNDTHKIDSGPIGPESISKKDMDKKAKWEAGDA